MHFKKPDKSCTFHEARLRLALQTCGIMGVFVVYFWELWIGITIIDYEATPSLQTE